MDDDYRNDLESGSQGNEPFEDVPVENPNAEQINNETQKFEESYAAPAEEPQQTADYDEPQAEPVNAPDSPFGARPAQTYENSYKQSYGANYSYTPPQQPQPQKPKKSRGASIFVLIIVLVVAAAGFSLGYLLKREPSDTAKAPAAQQQDAEENDEQEAAQTTANVAEVTAKPSSGAANEAEAVYAVARKFNVGILVYQGGKLASEGSGALVSQSDDGEYSYIVTCAHVINADGADITVMFEDGTEISADVVGMDVRTDIGVVRIKGGGYDYADFASSANLVVGQTVYAIGNPGGSEFFGSFTSGIISAIGRPISSSNTGYEMETIQHNAAINPGNSGGALVDSEGSIIGINSIKIASEEYEGMGFAVPSDVVMEVFNSIVKNGYVAGRAKLGIRYTTPSSYSQGYAMYVQVRGLPNGSIVIAQIDSDSELASQDVKVGDMIIKVNGQDMDKSGMLADIIEDSSVGDELTLTIARLDSTNWTHTEIDVKVRLVEDKGTTAAAETTTQAQQQNPFSGFGGYSDSDLYEFFKQFGGNG